jgi:hypothetical protein
MEFRRAELVDQLDLRIGVPVELESLRQAVVPPYLMLSPFIETPGFIEETAQRSLDEDGVHGCTFVIQATGPGHGDLTVGFRDLQTDDVTHRKTITVSAD